MAIYDIILDMENFFINKNITNNTDSKNTTIDLQYNDLKDNYEKIFVEAAENIRRELDKFKPENPCKICSIKNCNIEKKDIFANYPGNCAYREWQIEALTYLASTYKQKLKIDFKNMMDKKNEYVCSKCGACCKLAASEYSFQQLKQKANRGDKYAQNFTSIFVPFESELDAKNTNPEYFELLNKLVIDERIYYYHCTKLTKDNLCSIYEKRPNICKEFPHNPLKLLPSTCSFNEWKNNISHEAMLLKAKIDILDFYKGKIQ